MGLYKKIYAVVREVPSGNVASYGQIAKIVGDCSAREVGYAMAALKEGADVPWQRIINSRWEISPRTGTDGHHRQRILLEAEGVIFSEDGKIDPGRYGWRGGG